MSEPNWLVDWALSLFPADEDDERPEPEDNDEDDDDDAA